MIQYIYPKAEVNTQFINTNTWDFTITQLMRACATNYASCIPPFPVVLNITAYNEKKIVERGYPRWKP